MCAYGVSNITTPMTIVVEATNVVIQNLFIDSTSHALSTLYLRRSNFIRIPLNAGCWLSSEQAE